MLIGAAPLGGVLATSCIADVPLRRLRRALIILALPSDLLTREQQAWERAAALATQQSDGAFTIRPFYVPAPYASGRPADVALRQRAMEAALFGEPTGAPGPRQPPADLLLLKTVDAEAIPKLVARGLAVSLDQFARLDAGQRLSDLYYNGPLDALRFQGQLRAVPSGLSVTATAFDPSLFREAKQPLPSVGWTWADFQDLASRLTRQDGPRFHQWGYYDPGTLPVPLLIWQHGGDIVDTRSRAVLLLDRAVSVALTAYAEAVRRQRPLALDPTPPAWLLQSDRMTVTRQGELPVRVAMSTVRVTPQWPPPGTGGAPLALTEMPRAPVSGLVTYATVESMLLVGGRANQHDVAYRALKAMKENLPQVEGGPFSGRRLAWSDLRKLLRPTVSDDEVAIVERALETARAIPAEWAAPITRIMESEIRRPLTRGERTPGEAARTAADALTRALR